MRGFPPHLYIPSAIFPCAGPQVVFKLGSDSWAINQGSNIVNYPVKAAAMVRILQCQTFPINPPGAQPALSVEQIWEVLKIKSSSPHRFIPAITSSNVLEENEAGLTREVKFKEGMGPGGPVVEDITFSKPWKVLIVAAILSFSNENNSESRLNVFQVDFQARGPNASFISNIVSQGKDETELYLTFYFEWTYPDIQEGSEEEKKTVAQLLAMAKGVVQETIDVGRKMVKEGEVKV